MSACPDFDEVLQIHQRWASRIFAMDPCVYHVGIGMGPGEAEYVLRVGIAAPEGSVVQGLPQEVEGLPVVLSFGNSPVLQTGRRPTPKKGPDL